MFRRAGRGLSCSATTATNCLPATYQRLRSKNIWAIRRRAAVWRYGLAAVDDSWLLEHNAPTPRTPFTYRTAGEALRTITSDVLPGVLDVSGVQDLGYVNQFVVSSQKSWQEHARELATRERACCRVHDGKLVFQPVGQQNFTVDERDATFLPKGLTVAQPDKLGNDATIAGEPEPTTYVRDYFIGDGVSLGFYLSRSPFSMATVTVVEEEYAGTGLNPTLWYITDPNGKVTVGGGQLRLTGGPATVGLTDKLELAGGLRIQHGQVTFSAPSSGTMGGIYNGTVSDGNCVAGFRITPSGGACAIQALINGTSAGTALVTQAGHQYAFTTQLFANEAHRVRQIYCSSAHEGGHGRGGDTIAAAMRVVLSVHDVDPNNPGTLALPATVLFDDVFGSVPAFASYALANGADLHAQVAYTRLQRVVNAEVRSMIPDQAFRTRRPGSWRTAASATSRRRANCISIHRIRRSPMSRLWCRTAASARAIARVQDTNSIASHNVGADSGRRSVVRRMNVPPAPTSIDCENAALALLDDTVQPAWAGEYHVTSDWLPANDVLPGMRCR